MSRRILIINGHPDPDPARLNAALARAYAAGAQSAGHICERIDVGALSFPFMKSAGNFTGAPPHSDIVEARKAILAADHLVFLFPLWLGAPPAQLKAFMEWAGCGEFFLGQGKASFPKGKLGGRSARLVVTMGMPALIYRLYFGAHGVKAFAGGILRLAGVKPVRTTYLGGVGSGRERHWLTLLERLGRQAC